MMTNDQFIAWFTGLSRKIKGRPSKEDWAEILKQIDGIESKSTVKAWLRGRLSQLKGLPSEKLWREIRDYVAAEQSKAAKTNRLRDPFEVFDKKTSARETPETAARYPGSKGYGKK